MYTASWALRRPARLGAGVRGRLRGAGATGGSGRMKDTGRAGLRKGPHFGKVLFDDHRIDVS